MISEIPDLSDKTVDKIKQFISAYADELGCHEKKILAPKIFDLIRDKNGILVFYPLEETSEENDAFLLAHVPMRNGSYRDIVYINTFQTQEKQYYAAAHELGHMMDIVQEIHEENAPKEEREKIVNRFAAELLMPEKAFREFVEPKMDQDTKGGKIRVGSLLSIVVEAMSEFYVPYKSVIIRMFEIKRLKKKDAEFLIRGNADVSYEDIEKVVDQKIAEGGYAEKLKVRSQKRSIDGLAQRLEKAEKKRDVSGVIIKRLREEFGIKESQMQLLDESIILSETVI